MNFDNPFSLRVSYLKMYKVNFKERLIMLLVLRASKYFEKRGLRKKKSKVILQNPKVPVF